MESISQLQQELQSYQEAYSKLYRDLARRDKKVKRLERKLKRNEEELKISKKSKRSLEKHRELYLMEKFDFSVNKKTKLRLLIRIFEMKKEAHLRNFLGKWFHKVELIQEYEESRQSYLKNVRMTISQSIAKKFGTMFEGVVEENEDIEQDDDFGDMDDIPDEYEEVYAKVHEDLVEQCADAHITLVKECAARIMFKSLSNVSAFAKRTGFEDLKIWTIESIIEGKGPVNTYEGQGGLMTSYASNENNIKSIRTTLGPSLRDAVVGRKTISDKTLVSRFYSKTGENLAHKIGSSSLVQTFLSYMKEQKDSVMIEKQLRLKSILKHQHLKLIIKVWRKLFGLLKTHKHKEGEGTRKFSQGLEAKRRGRSNLNSEQKAALMHMYKIEDKKVDNLMEFNVKDIGKLLHSSGSKPIIKENKNLAVKILPRASVGNLSKRNLVIDFIEKISVFGIKKEINDKDALQYEQTKSSASSQSASTIKASSTVDISQSNNLRAPPPPPPPPTSISNSLIPPQNSSNARAPPPPPPGSSNSAPPPPPPPPNSSNSRPPPPPPPGSSNSGPPPPPPPPPPGSSNSRPPPPPPGSSNSAPPPPPNSSSSRPPPPPPPGSSNSVPPPPPPPGSSNSVPPPPPPPGSSNSRPPPGSSNSRPPPPPPPPGSSNSVPPPPPPPGSAPPPPPPGGSGPRPPPPAPGQGPLGGSMAPPPTTPQIVPPADIITKKLFWEVIPKYKLKSTFWSQGVSTTAKINFDSLASTFGEKKSNASETAVADKPVAKVQFYITDMKKANNSGIVLSRFEHKYPQLIKILNRMRDRKLKSEDIIKILSIAPKEDELEKLTQYKGTGEELMYSEKFLLECWVKTPLFQIRLEAIKFKLDFAVDLPELCHIVTTISEGLQIIKTSVSFKNLIGLVLDVGNYLNHGTNKGNASGFSLNTLSMLSSIRGTDKSKTPLLNFILDTLDKPGLNFLTEFESCREACRFELSDLDSKISEFNKGFSVMDRGKKLSEKFEDKAFQRFRNYIEIFLENNFNKYTEITQAVNAVKKEFENTLELFGEDKNVKVSEFFKKFVSFIDICKKNIEETSIRKGKEEMQRIAAAKKAAIRPEIKQEVRKAVRNTIRMSVRGKLQAVGQSFK